MFASSKSLRTVLRNSLAALMPTARHGRKLRPRQQSCGIEPMEIRQLLTGDFVFAKEVSGADKVLVLAVAANGDTLVAGENTNLETVFIRRLDAAGNTIWNRALSTPGTPLEPDADSLAVDADGNVYVAGRFFGVMDADPGAGVTELNATTGHGYLLKLNAAGEFQWARQMPCQNDGNTVAITANNDVIVAGEFCGTYTFATFPTEPEVNFGTTTRGFVSTYTSAGTLIPNATGTGTTTRVFGGSSSFRIHELKTDSAGNLHLSGTFSGTADFSPGSPIFNLTSDPEGSAFLMKLTPTGTLAWARAFAKELEPAGIVVNSAGAVFLTGSFSGTEDLDPGPGVTSVTSAGAKDVYVTRLGPTGNLVMHRQIGSSGAAGLHSAEAADIAPDLAGDLYVTGSFRGSVDFNPAPGTAAHTKAIRTSTEGSSPFVLKLSAIGEFRWTQAFVGTESSEALKIAVDAAGLVTTIGKFSGQMDFDGGLPVETRFGNSSSYISRLTPDLLYQTSQPGLDEIVLRRNQDTLQVFHVGLNQVVEEHPISAIRGVKISGQGFQSDTLTINSALGGTFGFAAGIEFNGGPSGGDKLQIVGTTGQSALYRPAASIFVKPEIRIDGLPIFFESTETFLVTGLSSLTVRTPLSADVLSLGASTGINGAAAAQLSGTNGVTTITSVRFHHVPTVVIDAATNDSSSAAGADVVTIHQSALNAAGLKFLTVNTGLGNDQLKVNATSLSLPVAGSLFKYDGGTGTDSVIATGDTNWVLASTTLAAAGGGLLQLTAIENATLTGGASNNTLDAGRFSGAVTLNGLGGNDILRSSSGGGTLNGGDGADELVGGVSSDVLNGGAGIDHFVLRGTNSADDLNLQRTSSGAMFRRRSRSSGVLFETDTITSDRSDRFTISALDGDDLIAVDSLFTQLGTADGGRGADTYLGSTRWTRVSV